MKSRKQYQLEQSIEKTLSVLIRLDPKQDMEQFKIHKNLFDGYADKYIRRYENQDEESLRENIYRVDSSLEKELSKC